VTAGLASRLGVPFTQLDNADPELMDELMGAVARVAQSGAFTLGDEVEAFESELARYVGSTAAVGVSSGTDALALSLRGLGVQPGDEVIVPTNSFFATAEAVVAVGAMPRLVDVDPVTHVITAEIVEQNLTPRTRCVVPVHLYGRTVDLDPILELARRHDLLVVEDACQALGAWYRGRRAGAIGHAGCFSFYPSKNLGAWGDGGAVVTQDEELARRIRLLRSHGEETRYHHLDCAGTSRLHGLQAAVLRAKLPRLDGWTEDRRRVGRALGAGLTGCPSVSGPAETPEHGDHVFHLFPVTTGDRDHMRDGLARRGVATAIHYPVAIHLQEAFAHLGMLRGTLPVAERLAREVCSLPVFPGMTDAQVEHVVDAVWDCARERP
jgi:dTDP-4-amino-4,6-dideoxygalactose transaminase